MQRTTSTTLKVGELAKRTGISVRTLHYYDEIGLVSPSLRTEAGYRLYGYADVARLQQVMSLRQLGLSLAEIRDCLARPGFSLQQVIELHIDRLKEQIEVQRALCARLEALAAHLRSAEEVSVDEFIQAMEMMNMFERYYTPEQMAEIKARGERLGAEAIRQAEAEWPELIAKVRAEMEKGTDPASESVQGLAKRWMELVDAFTGGNPEIESSLRKMYEQEPNLRQQTGVDVGVMEYMHKAVVEGKKNPG